MSRDLYLPGTYHCIFYFCRPQPVSAYVNDIIHAPCYLVIAFLVPVSTIPREVVTCSKDTGLISSSECAGFGLWCRTDGAVGWCVGQGGSGSLQALQAHSCVTCLTPLLTSLCHSWPSSALPELCWLLISTWRVPRWWSSGLCQGSLTSLGFACLHLHSSCVLRPLGAHSAKTKPLKCHLPSCHRLLVKFRTAAGYTSARMENYSCSAEREQLCYILYMGTLPGYFLNHLH